MAHRSRWWVAAWCALLALVIVGPALAPGFVLRYDMVFTPRQPLLAESVGLGSALPRAVPVDAVMALLTTVVPGDLLQKAVLLLTMWAAGYGAARLSPAAPLVAATVYTWSAYVAERLLIGHWSVLVAYACLPWIAAAGLRIREDAARTDGAHYDPGNPDAPSHLDPRGPNPDPGHSGDPDPGGPNPNPGGPNPGHPDPGGPNPVGPNPGGPNPDSSHPDPSHPNPGGTGHLVPGAGAFGAGAGAWVALVLACVPAVLVPTGGVLAAGVAIAAAGLRAAPRTVPLLVFLNAPWWLPALLHGAAGNGASDPAAVDAFAARGEGPGGAVVSVLGLGGIWNGDAVPAGRGGVLVPLTALLLVAAGGYGLWRLAAAWGRAPVVALAGLGGLGVVLAVAATVPGLDAALRWLVAEVPGAGLLRDGQKWAAWWALPAALGCAATTQTALAALRTPPSAQSALDAQRLPAATPSALDAQRPPAATHSALDAPRTQSPTPSALDAQRPPAATRTVLHSAGRAARGLLPVLAALVPVALLPGLAWGVGGELAPVRYPADWNTVRAIVERDPRPGDVLVLPFQPFRQFGWNDDRTQLDPAPRFLTRPAVVDDTLVVGDRALEGEDRRAAAVGAALGNPAELARLGIGWVLVEHGTPGLVAPEELAGLTPVHDGRWLALYRVTGPIAEPPDGVSGGAAARTTVIAIDIAVLLAAFAAIVLQVRRFWLRRRLPTSTFRSVAERGAI